MIKIYCDGSSRGNPGKGGFGVAVTTENKLITAIPIKQYKLVNQQKQVTGSGWILPKIKKRQTQIDGKTMPIITNIIKYRFFHFKNISCCWKFWYSTTTIPVIMYSIYNSETYKNKAWIWHII